MNNPAIILGFVLSTMYGAAFHLFKGGSLGRLVFNILLAWAGFWTGQLIASQIGFSIFRIGSLYVGIATIISILFLFIGHWLSVMDHNNQKPSAN